MRPGTVAQAHSIERLHARLLARCALPLVWIARSLGSMCLFRKSIIVRQHVRIHRRCTGHWVRKTLQHCLSELQLVLHR